MATIKSVQTGKVTSLGSGTTDVTISSVDTTKSIVWATWRMASATTGNCLHSQVAYTLTSGTNLRFFKGGANTIDEVVWYVVEFDSGVSVQHLSGSVSGTGTTATISLGTEVLQGKSAILFSQYISAGAPSTWNQDDFSTVKLRNSGGTSGYWNQAYAERQGGFAGIDCTYYVQVLEFADDATVEQFVDLSMTGTTLSQALTTSIAKNKYLGLVSFREQAAFNGNIDNVVRVLPDSDPVANLNFDLKTDPGAWYLLAQALKLDCLEVQHYDVTVTDATLTVDTNLSSAVPQGSSFPVIAVFGGGHPNGIVTNASTSNGRQGLYATVELITASGSNWTQFQLKRATAIGSSNSVTYHVAIIVFATKVSASFTGGLEATADSSVVASFGGGLEARAPVSASLTGGVEGVSGFFALRDYVEIESKSDALAEKSALCYDFDEDYLYTVTNNAHVIRRFDRKGNQVGSDITFPVGNDLEGIEYLGKTSGFPGTFVIMEEGEGTAPYDVVRFYFFTMDGSTATISSGDVTTIDCSDITTFASKGCEGVAYDRNRGKFINVVQDMTSGGGGLWETTISGGTATSTLLFRWFDTIVAAGWLPSTGSISDVAINVEMLGFKDSIFVLGWDSVNAQTGQGYVFEMNRSGDILSVLDIGAIGQIEGLAFDTISEDLYLTGEETGTNWIRYAFRQVSAGGSSTPIGLEATGWRYSYDDVDYFSTSPKFYEGSFDPDSPPGSNPAWGTGQALIGYGALTGPSGDRTLRTNIGKESPSEVRALYLRKTFNISDLSAVGSATVELYADDAAAVWINGTEVATRWSPPSPRSHSGAAGTTIGAPDEGALSSPISVDPSVFVEGTNVIAVAVFNVNSGSSDLGSDLILTLVEPTEEPVGARFDGGLEASEGLAQVSSSHGGGLEATAPVSAAPGGGLEATAPVSASFVAGLEAVAPVVGGATGGLEGLAASESLLSGGLEAKSPAEVALAGGIEATAPVEASFVGGEEASTGASSSLAGGLEAVAPVLGTATGGLEATAPGAVVASFEGGLEATAPIEASLPGGLEGLAAAAGTASGGLEAVAPVLGLFVGGEEALSPASSALAASLEATAPVEASIAGGAEGAAFATSSLAGGLEATAPVVGEATGGLEAMVPGLVTATFSGGLEAWGLAEASLVGGLEASAPIAASFPGALEALAAANVGLSGGLEAIGLAAGVLSGGLEGLAPVVGDTNGGLEGLAAAAGSLAGGLEALGAPAAVLLGGLEATGPLAGSFPGGLESVVYVLSTMQGGLEAIGYVLATTQGGLEAIPYGGPVIWKVVSLSSRIPERVARPSKIALSRSINSQIKTEHGIASSFPDF